MSVGVVGLALLICLGITFFLYKFFTWKIDADARNLSFKKEPVKIQEILASGDVAAGSGALYIPILGSLFPKLWGQKMKQTKRYYIVTDELVKHEISSEEYELLSHSNNCQFVYGKQSAVRVGVETSLVPTL